MSPSSYYLISLPLFIPTYSNTDLILTVPLKPRSRMPWKISSSPNTEFNFQSHFTQLVNQHLTQLLAPPPFRNVFFTSHLMGHYTLVFFSDVSSSSHYMYNCLLNISTSMFNRYLNLTFSEENSDPPCRSRTPLPSVFTHVSKSESQSPMRPG